MIYESFVEEMIDWFPHLRSDCMTYMDEDEPLPYVALGAVLIPWFETCLEMNDTANIERTCEFLEAAAAEARDDNSLDNLIGIEIGEWLPGVKERKLLLSHLGPETQRVCRYHISRLCD